MSIFKSMALSLLQRAVKPYDKIAKDENPYQSPVGELYVCKDLSTGEYFRGSDDWMWCKSLRYAAWMTKENMERTVALTTDLSSPRYSVVPISDEIL